jgi:hypothetical protein
MGTAEPLDDGHGEFRTGADTPPVPATYLVFLGVGFDGLDPPELVAHVQPLGERYLGAAQPR